MKEANLISIVNAYRNLDSPLFKSYIEHFNIQIKSDEMEDLESLIHSIYHLNTNIAIYEGYYLGYIIPQIGKEFDLLRIGPNYIINIELKSISTHEKIKKQLERNRYYLSFLGKRIYTFTYVSQSKKLFEMNERSVLSEVTIEYLIEVLSQQVLEKINDLDSLFNPSNYLVSPFNSTRQFIGNKYFLTSQQEEYKNLILKKLDSKKYEILVIKGKAGTGKTLLTYDIAKEYISKSKNILIIHCGQLNLGHNTLREEYGWNIHPARDTFKINFNRVELVIVDEAQRIYPNQLKHIVETTAKESAKCIFSYDGQQCLRKEEIENNNEEYIDSVLTYSAFELTGKIRTNKEIASFILCLFDKRRQIEKIKHPNVELNYFNNHQQAKKFLLEKQKDNWKVINYTPSNRHKLPYDLFSIENNQDNAHTVIGQEYDKVLAVIDKHFYYKNEKNLSTKNYPNQPYYHPSNMLFQIMSRTRLKLGVVIINNRDILERCLSIVNAN
ncbi:ATP-binding protein [Sphingobacterium sp. UDSM-2020]|uniref:ATP-binding protein n=1 Tax=Sphingobacterium sp. UDSM-2020 TaxID=2795738 RepID=UPI001936EE85|nr:ATP-binding protein [Sphingobacterium sp. UDSM-2020]QQD12347.1 ATP-binding protein [Sphingobacterium sp. UDSM-2020]